MKILITGARGFVGKNLTENLKNIRDGKNRTRSISVEDILSMTLIQLPGSWRNIAQSAILSLIWPG